MRRMEAETCRCWTRVTRQRTTEPTLGRGVAADMFEGVGPGRGTEMVGLSFLVAAGMVKVRPMIEARMFVS